jgi:hypothetical protein
VSNYQSATYKVKQSATAKVKEAIQNFKKFESVYSPELVGAPVVFTDFEMVAGKR